MNGNAGNGSTNIDASAESGRTVISSWQETDADGMTIRPVPPAQAPQQGVQGVPAQPPQAQQWSQNGGQGGWQQPYQQGQAFQSQARMNQQTPSQTGAQPMPYGSAMAQAPYRQGGFVPQEQEIPMQGASVPQFVPQRKSKVPFVMGVLVLATAIVVGVAVLSGPKEPPRDKPDTQDTVVATDKSEGSEKPSSQDPVENVDVPGDDDGGTTDSENSPTTEDFQWASAQWIKEGHVPERATRLTDLESVLGGWKGYIRYEPTTAGDELVEEFLNVTAGGDRTSATFLFDWGYVVVRNGGARYDDEAGDAEFLGTWDGENGAIYATCESGNLEMKRFWDEDGRQYAYGTITLPDGAIGDVYMTRP